MLFFFDTHDGERQVIDGSGTELPDEDEALEQAVSLLRDLSHVLMAPDTPRSFAVRVRRPGGGELYAASMRFKVDRLG